MGLKENNEDLQEEFSEIIKRAYERGLNETGMTVQKLMEELKIDLRNMKVN
ncbi:hypothetical protein [Neobacillus sp. FSL H8-0543]|uniref:hypothetical protein n=1 Tax=Neobacillus sp. FSL H8-0543 TaxID=2954672 RepID=UPI0031584C54